MPVSRKNKNMKKSSKFSKISKSHKQNILQKKCKTVKNMKVMRGGGGEGEGVEHIATDKEIERFFNELTTKQEEGYFFFGKQKQELDPEFFIRDPNKRHGIILNDKWHYMINNQFNNFFQTPLYVLLRFGKSSQLIDILLNVPNIDVNRKNSDGSTALIGLCFGKNMADVINWQKLSYLFTQFSNKGADLTISNNRGETPFSILKDKGERKFIDYSLR